MYYNSELLKGRHVVMIILEVKKRNIYQKELENYTVFRKSLRKKES